MWTCLLFILFELLIHNNALASKVDQVYVAHNNAIIQLGPNTSTLVVSADSPIVAFDIHPDWRQLFWATDFYIYRTPLYDVQTSTVVAVTGRVSAGGLAVDSTHQAVYWSDVTAGRLEAARLDGTGRRVVYETNWTLGALALNPLVGEVFWIESTEVEGQPLGRIKSSDLVGSNEEVLASYDNLYPESPLAIDTEFWALYFYRGDGSVSEQWELSYGGLRPPGGVRLFELSEPPARSLVLTRGGFYYSSGQGLTLGLWKQKTYSIVHGNISASYLVLEPSFTMLDEDLSSASQIRVLHGSSRSQPRPRDAGCSAYRCQQECSGPQAYSCFCRYGFSIKEDNRSCLEDGYVIYSTTSTFGRAKMDGSQHTIIFNHTSANIQTFDIHVESGQIFWADLNDLSIYRAPIDTPARRTVIVQNVSAYGLAVDWVHSHLYWSEDSRVMIASLDGDNKMELLTNLDSPEDLAVDPISGFIFWVECGESLSLKRASLSGANVTTLANHVICGSTITLDPESSSVYWLDWMGTVHRCRYDGVDFKDIYVDLIEAIAVVNRQPLWFPIDENGFFALDGETFFFKGIDIKPNALKIVKTSQQPPALSDVCVDTDCTGLCLPDGNVSEPLCICPGKDFQPEDCSTANEIADRKGERTEPLLRVLSATPFSATLVCAGALFAHPFQQPALQVTEVDSLVSRPKGVRPPWSVRVDDKTLPFTIDTLNPATTYSVMLRNRVTRASFSLTVHTPPPPLRVDRLPLITLPRGESSPKWLPQGVHYLEPNPWQDLVEREYLLLLISKTQYHSSDDPPHLDSTITKMIKEEIKEHFLVLKHYKTKEMFDDDPTMHLGNIPWEEQFWLAMVQVTEYRGSFHLDFVYSEKFSLPDTTWTDFMNGILKEYDQYEMKSQE